MGRGWVLSLFTAVFSMSFALRAEGPICPTNDGRSAYTYRGVHCCLGPELSQKTCEDRIDELPLNVLHLIQEVSSDIERQRQAMSPREISRFPNCYWFALRAFEIDSVLSPRFVASEEMKIELTREFEEVAEFTAGSDPFLGIVEFLARTKTAFYEDDGKKVWSEESPYTYHAAVALRGGLVLQKDFKETENFTLLSLKEAQALYTGFLNFNPQIERGHIEIRKFQKRPRERVQYAERYKP